MGILPQDAVTDLGPLSDPLSFAISRQDRQTMAMVQEALQMGRVRLAFQPVVIGANPDRIAFYEGLIRILDRQGRVIPARDFIGAVESREIGRLIDCAALDIGLKALVRHADIRLAINMSARSIGYPRWMQILKHGLNSHPTIAERLILEISESSAVQMPEIVTAFMDDLQREGISFSLDDFGAGYTALRYFRDFFFDAIKIDGEFVRNIHQDKDNQTLAKAFLSIARHFDLFTIAEEVETIEEARFLQSIGIDCMQGYLFGAPAFEPRQAERARQSA